MNVLPHLSAYLANTTPAEITLLMRDGTVFSNISIIEVLDDGLLFYPTAADTSFKQYVPLEAIGVVQIQEVVEP